MSRGGVDAVSYQVANQWMGLGFSLLIVASMHMMREVFARRGIDWSADGERPDFDAYDITGLARSRTDGKYRSSLQGRMGIRLPTPPSGMSPRFWVHALSAFDYLASRSPQGLA